MRKYFPALFSVALLLSAWQIWSLAAGNQELVPGVPRLLAALANRMATETFYRSVAATLLRGSAGLAVSLAAAALTAVLFSRYRALYRLLRPVLVWMRSVPVISFILLALVFLQPESIPLLIAFLTMFPLLSENLTEGMKHLQPGLAAFGKTFRIRRFNYRAQVLYPQIKPFLFSGLASAAGFGWRAVIMGEVLAQCASGIGSEMKKAQTFIDLPSLLGWTLVAAAIGYLADRGVAAAARFRIPVLYRQGESDPGWLPVTEPRPDIQEETREESLLFRQEKSLRTQRTGLGRDTGPAGRPESGNTACRYRSTPAVVLKDVGFSYAGRPSGGNRRLVKEPVLRRFSYTFEKGRIYGLSAPSGAGKSTLLQLIAGILRPDSGSVEAAREAGMAFMFQEPELMPELTARENIELPLASLWSRAVASQEAERCLRLTETDALACRRPCGLSYGQQQRVALARALAYPSPVLLLDEPFKGLDRELAARIIRRIRQRRQWSGQTIIFASHKAEELEALADKILRIG